MVSILESFKMIHVIRESRAFGLYTNDSGDKFFIYSFVYNFEQFL